MQQVPERWRYWRIRHRSWNTATGRLRYTMTNTTTHSRFESHSEFQELAALRAEAPDEHGIRRRFVNRIREMIAAGQYETSERWDYTEEILLGKLEEAI